MQKSKRTLGIQLFARKLRTQRGVALVTTLLLLLLMTALSLAMVMSVRSDMLINGYYRNFRGSFYAADSGLNVVRRDIINQFMSAIPATFNPNVSPMPANQWQTIGNNIAGTSGTYKNAVSLVPTGQTGKTLPEQFKITSLSLAPVVGPVVPPATTPVPDANGCSIQGGNPGSTCATHSGNISAYVYTYAYKMTATGQSAGNEAATLTDEGTITITANVAPANSKTSFAAWGMFINTYNICDPPLVPGTLTGPVFTNGAWNFSTAGSYIFTDSVGQVSAKAGYEFPSCVQVAGPSAKSGNTTIAPTFKNGFNMAQPSVALPQNDFNQKRAVIDGKGDSCGGAQLPPCAASPVTASEMSGSLKNVNKIPYPNTTAGGSNLPIKQPGVWLPYTSNDGQNTFTGGGIMVEGDAQVTLSTSGNCVAGSACQQIYTIVQSPPTVATATTTTIKIDPLAGQTTVTSGGTTLNITGVPEQMDPATGAIQGPATMLYVDGNITSLSGPGQGLPAIQDNSAVTITAANNVTVTGDILYKTEPITLTAQGSTPADTLIAGNDKGQALGIFTATGDIQLKNGQTNGNLEIDASLATISATGTGGLINVGSSINTLTIVGGRIQNNIKNIGATTRNVFFDRRYANGFAPPWFPSTTVTLGGLASSVTVPSVSRRQWQNKTAYF